MIPENQGSVVAQVRLQATPRACRRFAVTLLLGLPVAGLAWLLLVRLTSDRWVWPVLIGFCAAALLLGGSALLAPTWARWFYIGWHAVTRVIELALTWVLLALVFWLVITPVGLVRRGRASPFKRFMPRAKSYWQNTPPVKDPARYYRQF